MTGRLGWLVLACATATPAQQPLSLLEAARVALAEHPAIEAAAAGSRAAEAGVTTARAGYFPRLSVTESYLRSDNPVFVFGTLLNQARFGQANFDVDRLNRPESLQNFQSLLRVEQTLFDANRTKHAVRAARLEAEISDERRRENESDVLLGVARTYFGVALTRAAVGLAEESLRAAEADLKLARDLHEAGMTTRADEAAMEARRAELEARLTRARADFDVAQAALNDALGLDLELRRELTTPLAEAPAPARDLAGYQQLAVERRADLKTAALSEDLARSRTARAKAERWPTAVARGVLEADTQRFVDRGAGNWLVGASLEWDLWNGSRRGSAIAAARHGEERAEALRRRASSSARLDVRRAYAAFQAAAESLGPASRAIEHATESLRIVRDRYQAGLEDVTSLLRAETALEEARFRRLAGVFEQRAARAELDHAAGVLTLDSEALR